MNIKNNFLNAYNLLPKKEKNYVKLLALFLFISFFIEIISIGILIPSISFFLSPEIYQEKYYFIFKFFENFNSSENNLKNILLLSLFIIFFIKFIFLMVLNYLQSDFQYNVQLSLSKKILNKYVFNPYYFFVKTNSSVIIRNSITEVEQFAVALISYNFFFNEILIIIGITFLLLVFQPKMTIILIIAILLLILIYNLVTKKVIKKFGIERQKFDAERIKSLNETIGSIKQIKLESLEEYFLKDFNFKNKKTANSLKWIKIYQSFPKNIIEIFIVTGFLGIGYFFLENRNLDNEFIVIGSVYMICVVKLMPSVNRILSSFQRIRYSEPVINNFKKELEGRSNFQKSIDIDKIESLIIELKSFSYPDNDIEILKNLKLNFKKGNVYGIVGSSGSGKSTLINIFTGLLETNNLKIKLNDNLEIDNFNYLKNMIGYMPQNTFLLDNNIIKNIALGMEEKDIDINKIKQLIIDVNLTSFIKKSDQGLNSRVGEKGALISGGQLQRLGLARALYKNPPILILDEFTSSLDDENEAKILEKISEIKKDKIIIISSHSEKVKKICDVVYKIHNNTLIVS